MDEEQVKEWIQDALAVTVLLSEEHTLSEHDKELAKQANELIGQMEWA